MSNFKIDRRRFLSSSGVALTLPLLESLLPLRSAYAAGSGPGRAVFLYMPNGTYNKKDDAPWHPPTGKLTSNLPDVLKPFSANIGDFSVLKELQHNVRNQTNSNWMKDRGVGGAHVSAVSSFLSQQAIQNPSSKTCNIARPSIDQIIAQKTGKQALNLHIGGMTGTADNSPFNYSNLISYNNGKGVTPMSNPHDVYSKLFGMVATNTKAAIQPLAAPVPAQSQKSILDNAMDDLRDLRGKLGKVDQSKLDEYLDSVRAVESRIETNPSPTPGPGSTPFPTPAPGGACTPPASPPASMNNYGGGGMTDYVQRTQAYFDMIAFAFQCDLIRSVTFMFDGEVGERILSAQVPSGMVFNGATLNAGMHIGIAHNGGRNRNVTKDRVYMYLLVYLINKLKSLTDASGSPVLDNTMILMGYGIKAGDHGAGVAPSVIAGGRNFINPGYSYDASNWDMKDVLFTMGSVMNIGITSFEGSSKKVAI